MEILAYSVGVSLMTFAGHHVAEFFLGWLRLQVKPKDICDDAKVNDQWQQLLLERDSAGMWIGIFERLVFFASIDSGQWEVAGAWIAFKVAAKWQAWSTIVKVPDELEGVHPLRFAIARRAWAAREYATYVVGTALNGGMALMGYGIVRFLAM